MKPLISVVTPTYHEADNVLELYERIKKTLEDSGDDHFELIFIDNASSDDTVARIKELAAHDPRVKLIVNARNFGPLRSPQHALLQAQGDAVVLMASDLQDPPELIPQFLAAWRTGVPIVLAVKVTSDEAGLMYRLRGLYYQFLIQVGDVAPIKHATGFGCYDRRVIEGLRQLSDPYPYFRGQLAELGFPQLTIPYHQPLRQKGTSKIRLFTLYDLAMLGLTSHSKVPLRLAIFAGFAIAAICLLVAFAYLIAKLFFWNQFPGIGQAPTVIGLFFLGGVQLIFTGILGEYIGAILTHVRQRPLVFEKERVNFAPPALETRIAQADDTHAVAP